MSDLTREERSKIIREEMISLVEQGYISADEFKGIMDAHVQYTKDQLELQTEKNQSVDIKSNQALSGEQHSDTIMQSEKQAVTKQEIKRPKAKTAEQIRERNITWLLILGVSFLLISGLVVATSTWEQMGALLKVITLIGVSFFFLALSGLSSKFLKIEKTAFAFLTLGSLLLPITIIAIGYFELLGSYLSLTGEGRYLLGVICTLLPLPLYARNAWKNNSRLFVWIFFLFMSFFVGFSIAAMRVSVDVFYFLIMIYNAALLYGYHRYRHQKTIHLFVKELPAYAQLNLIVSTLLMLFVFDQELFYSFNILLTAVMYIAMVYVYNTKEYQFVFSALFAYGAYQLTEHSWLQSVDLFVYGLIGAAYLYFAFLTRKDAFLEKMFHYTSGIISLFAFIYVSFQGIIIRENENSWILLLAYITIAGSYIYLAYITERQVFRWLAPIFLFICGWQFWDLAIQPFTNISIQLFIFLYASVLFILIGVRNTSKYLQAIQMSTYYLSLIAMLLAIMYGLLFETYIQVSFMFILLGCLAWFVSGSKRKIETEVANWANAISWLFALIALLPELIANSFVYHYYFNSPFHLAISGLFLLMISLAWKKAGRKGLEKTAFYTGQFSYFIGVLQLAFVPLVEDMFLRPAILIAGIGVSIWLVRRSGIEPLWLTTAVMTFLSYASLLSTFAIERFELVILFLLFAPVLLLGIDRLAGKYVEALKPYFFWLAHSVQGVLVMLIFMDQLIGQSINPIILFIPFMVYIYSTLLKHAEWQVKLFLYLGLTMVPFLLMSHITYHEVWEQLPLGYYWIVSSLLMVIIWKMVPLVWKKRIEWYLIPFSNFSLVTVIMTQEVSMLLAMVVVLSFVLLNLYLLHMRKWSLATILPLVLSLIFWEQQGYVTEDLPLLLISIGCFFILLIAGRLIYSQLIHVDKQENQIDWYSIVALIYIGYSFNFIEPADTVWVRIIPYVLAALWLFLQVSRINQKMVQKVLITLGALSFLPPYYLVWEVYLEYIPDLFHAELLAFPVLVLSIVLARKTWRNYQHIMTHVQTVILVLITIYLVADAMQSSTVWDALIVGTLSLAAFLLGMKFRIKSYFFVGLGTLLFNVIYQTKPYWGNMPWWVYLLIAGITLIGIASYNEWSKQRKSEGKLVRKAKELISRLKEWN